MSNKKYRLNQYIAKSGVCSRRKADLLIQFKRIKVNGSLITKLGHKVSENDVVELRRLCCIDNTPKCTESYFIGKTLRWLKKNSDYKVVVSYADAHYNHTGIIYKATNFEYRGLTSKGKVIDFDGKLYHDKCIRTYHIDTKGVKRLKPFAQRVKDALEDGRAKYVNTPGKHIYVFRLKK